jgi:hypothetical protein
MFGHHRWKKNGTIALSASFDGALTAHVSVTGKAEPPVRGSIAVTPAELYQLHRELTNWCHEHRVALKPGALTLPPMPHGGGVPVFVQLTIGFDRCWFALDIGEGTSTWSMAVAFAHYERMRDAVAAYLRECDVIANYQLLESLESERVDEEVLFDEIVVSHLEQSHWWEVRQPCDDLASDLARLRRWMEENDIRLRGTALAFLPVLEDELFFSLAWMAPKDWDQEKETVKGLAMIEENGGRLMFRVRRDKMHVGIRHDGGRVWMLLNPDRDRVVKSSEDAYIVTAEDMERIRKAETPSRAALRELESHLGERAWP